VEAVGLVSAFHYAFPAADGECRDKKSAGDNFPTSTVAEEAPGWPIRLVVAMRSGSHLGTGFTVWNRQQTWFWAVVNHHRNEGSVGAAATEAEAVHEACSSIEEMPVRAPSDLTLGADETNAQCVDAVLGNALVDVVRRT
jgi:cytochrome c1